MHTLNDRLEEWLREEASERAADLYPPVLVDAFTPGSTRRIVLEDGWDNIREQLLSSGFTPALIQRATEAFLQAREEELSVLDYFQDAYQRYADEEAVQAVMEHVEQAFGGMEADRARPEDVLAVLWVVEQQGMGAAVAKAQQEQNIREGLSTN